MKNKKAIHKQFFYTTVLLTLLSGVCSVSLSSKQVLSEHQKILFETSNSTWKIGTYAICGYLGRGELEDCAEDD